MNQCGDLTPKLGVPASDTKSPAITASDETSQHLYYATPANLRLTAFS